MPRVKQTDEERLSSLRAKLEKAKKLKEQWTKTYNNISTELEALEKKARYSVIDTILGDSEKLETLLELGVITQEQYSALTRKEPSNE